MPYRVTEDLYSDTNPVDAHWNGQVSTSGGNFQVASAGGLLSDEDAARFGLSDTLAHVTEAQIREDQEAKNRATYAENAGLTKAHTGYPTNPATETSGSAGPSPTGANVINVGNPATEGAANEPDTGKTAKPPKA